MNKAVFTAALIERAGYKQDVSFVGHSDTVEVTVRPIARFEPIPSLTALTRAIRRPSIPASFTRRPSRRAKT